MSLVHRTARLGLVALLATAWVGCGDDDAFSDDDDDGADDGTTIDAGDGDEIDAGEPDAAPSPDAAPTPDAATFDAAPPDGGGIDASLPPDAGEIDAGTPDAGPPDAGPVDAGTPDAGTPDAGPPDAAPPDDLDGEFLLGIVAGIFPDAPIRFITTVDFTPSGGGGTAGTADFSFQAINAAVCVPGQGGFPVNAPPLVANDVPINADGTFTIEFIGQTLPGPSNPVPVTGIQCTDLTANITVNGTIVSADVTCGTVETPLLPLTFGAIRIPPGTIGDANLPPPLTACP